MSRPGGAALARLGPGLGLGLALGLAAGACGGGAAPPGGARPPDVVVLLTDDQGWHDVGYHGSEIATPRIDALAAEGLVLERFYVQPICTATRAALLTGRNPLRLGLVHNLRPEHTAGLPPDAPTLPELLAPAGYESVLVGKWHLGHARPEQRPEHRGFDHAYGLLGGFVDYYDHTRDGRLDWWRDGEPLTEPGYTTRLLAAEAVRTIETHDPARPLFLWVAFNAPHGPVQLAPGREPEGATEAERIRNAYAGMVEELDAAIGRVLDALDARGMADHTLVLFASDNGGSIGHGGDNAPLRYGKFGVFEGGIRVPAVLRWPGHVPSGTSDQVIVDQDLAPTLLAAAGLPPAPAGAFDGTDVLPALTGGPPIPRADLVWAVRRRTGYRLAARRGRWKLVRAAEGDPEPLEAGLFDVDADPGETTDRSAEHPELVRELEGVIEAWLARYPGDLDARPR